MALQDAAGHRALGAGLGEDLEDCRKRGRARDGRGGRESKEDETEEEDTC